MYIHTGSCEKGPTYPLKLGWYLAVLKCEKFSNLFLIQLDSTAIVCHIDKHEVKFVKEIVED